MKLLLFLVLLNITSCSEKNLKYDNIDLIIEESQSYEYDLKKEMVTIFYMSKPKLEIKFQLSEKEKESITQSYYDLKIHKIKKIDNESGNIYIKDECEIMPKMYTIIKIKTAYTFQEIKIDESCDDFYLSNFNEAKRIKKFTKFVMSILQSKSEIKKAPKSDIMYL